MTLPIYTKINVTPLSLVHGLCFQICRFMGLMLRSVEAWKLGRGLAEDRRKEDLKGVCGRTQLV